MNGDLWKSSGVEAQRAHPRPKGRPCEGAESQPPDCPHPQCPAFGGELGASHFLLQERVVSRRGMHWGHPSPCQLTPHHHHHHHHPSITTTTTHTKKLDTF